MSTDLFPEKRFSEQCWTHNLVQLLNAAGLSAALDADGALDSELSANWDAVIRWTESSRYARSNKTQAEEIYDAISDKKHGILSWLKAYW